MADPSTPPAPDQLADFEIISRLGAGGMAEVFLAKKRGAEGTYKLLVVKRILPAHASARRFRAMFVEEAHLATRLNHPNIVQVYEFSDHTDDGLLLSMEYVEGFDLGKLVRAARRRNLTIPPYVAAYIVAEAAKGLHYAHERKDESGEPLAIVHRDVSPQNVLLSRDGVVKIADFGIASANLFREEPGTLKGKFVYMSPEQARGERVDRRSDIFSLGVVLYELLTLRLPYGELSDDELLEAVREARITPPEEMATVPEDLTAIVHRAMAPKPDDRYASAREMSGAVARVLLARQELIDHASVEAMLTEIVAEEQPKESDETGSRADHATQAAAPLARAGEDEEGAPGDSEPRAVREVRHVAVVTLRLLGMAAQGAGALGLRWIRRIVDDLAYKHGAVWTWTEGFPADYEPEQIAARALIGLTTNPARAAAEAGQLAADIHETLSGASEDLPEPLRAAVGIVRGIAAGQRDDRGHLIHHELRPPAMFLAEQLGKKTPFGATWAAGGVYRLVRREFRWEDAPVLEVDDAEPFHVPARMHVHAMLRPLTREERAAEAALASSDLVGRDVEKADLHAAMHRALSGSPTPHPEPPDSPGFGGVGRGQLVARVIVGEMGIGKTALVTTFLGEVTAEIRLLSIECSPVQSELPFGTFADLLRAATGITIETGVEEAKAVLEELFGAGQRSHQSARIVMRLAELASGKQMSLVEDEPAFRRDVVLAGARYLFGALAQEKPLIVVVDGLQWADRASLDLLSQLLGRGDPLPILALLLTRPDERVEAHIEGLVRIELAGLSPEEQVRLVETRIGVRRGVAEVCGELLPRVAGNPFFLLEMVDALLERGTLEIIDTDSDARLIRHEHPSDLWEALPSTLEQLIGDRLRELPKVESDVVHWLAVAGGPLQEADVVALARLTDDEAITRLCARGLCDRKGAMVDFRHPLARDVAYFALDPGARSRMHRELGEHLATTPLAQGLSAAIIARHLARGEAPSAAAEHYIEAAIAARSAHQAQLARRYFGRALSLLPRGDVRRLTAHEGLEAIFRHLGRRRDRRNQLESLRRIAREIGHGRWVAIALVRTARFEADEGRLARGLPLAQRAVEIAQLAHQPIIEVEAQTILSEILRELGDTPGALSACESAQEMMYSSSIAPRARAEVLRARGVLLRYVGRLQESSEVLAESVAVCKAVGARRSEARAKSSLSATLLNMERFEDAIALGMSAVNIDLAIGGRFQIAKTLSNVGQAYGHLGDTPRALSFLRRAREAHERYADQDSRADTLLVSAEVMMQSGDMSEAESMCRDAAALTEVTGSVYDLVHQRIAQARLACFAEDWASAIAHASEARSRAEAQALMSFYVYATAIEALARTRANESHTGVLLAQTALGAVEASVGSEFGIEVRSLCCDALTGSPASQDARRRARSHAERVAERVRDERLRDMFLGRADVRNLLSTEASEGPAA